MIIRVADIGKKEISSADDETLRSFLLSREAIQRLDSDAIAEFRACRRQILTDYFQQFVADRLGDRVDVRPSIQSIVKAAAE